VTQHLRAAIAIPALALACGSNPPEVPDELLGATSGCTAPSYPSEGIGKEPGDVVPNTCFVGYRAPDRVTPRPEARETVAFSDYYDPTGSKGVGLLLINTAAIWCGACVSEHETLPEHYQKLAPKGLAIISGLFEDASRNPASIQDVERWIARFDTNFPMVADSELYLADYASTDLAPLNMLVDPRTMKIVRKYLGDQGSVMWPDIEATLDAQSASF